MTESDSTRRGARFIVLSDGAAPSSRREPSASARGLTWRVVAANNRPLGRSKRVFADFDACVTAAAELHLRHDALSTAISFDRTSASWRWTVALHACPVAVSVRAYSRRVECERAMSQFLEIVRRQPPVINEIRYVAPGSRPS